MSDWKDVLHLLRVSAISLIPMFVVLAIWLLVNLFAPCSFFMEGCSPQNTPNRCWR